VSQSAGAPGHVPSAKPPRLEARGVSKRFGSFLALDDVSFCVRPGSVHALLGENGAGKSTLVKCIMGFYRADGGQVLVGDSSVNINSPRDAQQHGLGMVYQHFTLVENMTVAENLVLARAHVPPVLDWRREHAAIEEFMDSMPFRVPVRHRVRQLAAGDKQKLEILKQLYLGSRIIILDEPTSVLTPQEADDVLGMLRSMTEAGRLSVAMITHRFREVTAFADDVTVLRRGRVSGSGKADAHSTRQLGEMMVGSELPNAHPDRSPSKRSRAVLEIEALCADDDIGLPAVRSLNLSVHAGEVVGIAGVSGNGQDELIEVLAGQRLRASGVVKVNGAPYHARRRQIREQGVRLLPEAPLVNACVAHMSVSENIAFRNFDEPRFTVGGWLVNRSELRRQAREVVASYGVKTTSVDAPMGDLSGGNVQRAVLARELASGAQLLITANPCFGLDFQAVADIRSRILAASRSGTAVLLVSADLDEVFALADRILVMSEGELVYETPGQGADLAEIGRKMAGHAA
jgi:simple sugar transport system ATP-binding protein